VRHILTRTRLRTVFSRCVCPMMLVIPVACLPVRGQQSLKANRDPTAQSFASATQTPGTSSDHVTPPSSSEEPNPSDNVPASASGIKPNAPLPLKPAPIDPVFQPQLSSTKFKWKAALLQSFEYTMFEHVWRAAFDPSLRYQLEHKPFFHDWFVSYSGYNLHRWGDGDDFIVNDVGHPLQGAVYSRIFLQNDPRSFR
jgi:hypothetical protein